MALWGLVLGHPRVCCCAGSWFPGLLPEWGAEVVVAMEAVGTVSTWHVVGTGAISRSPHCTCSSFAVMGDRQVTSPKGVGTPSMGGPGSSRCLWLASCGSSRARCPGAFHLPMCLGPSTEPEDPVPVTVRAPWSFGAGEGTKRKMLASSVPLRIDLGSDFQGWIRDKSGPGPQRGAAGKGSCDKCS